MKEARADRSQKKLATVIERPRIIHRDKLFGGRETAMEVHRRLAWNDAPCYVCGSRETVIELQYSMSPRDLMVREPAIAAVRMADNEGRLPIWRSKYGALVRFAVEHACSKCRKQVEIDAARLPSHILVEIDRGPGEDKPQVQVAG